jgi:hypothetical protein
MQCASRPARRALTLAFVALFLVALLAAPASAARRRVPVGFLGVDAGSVLVDPGLGDRRLGSELTEMVRTGVESVRIAIYWSLAQPYSNAFAVPPGQGFRYQYLDGVPTDWSQTDRIYRVAAARRLQVLPTILAAPIWARLDPKRPWSPPADPATYGRFVGRVVQRYGRGGAFWRAHPELPAQPTRQWQIWNEPLGGIPGGPTSFWDDPGHPAEPRYVAILRSARKAIKAADPHGQVVLAGLFGEAWRSLADLYRFGVHGLFDVAAINLFTKLPKDEVFGLKLVRSAMARNGDRRLPVELTEFSWPTARGHFPGYAVSAQQAARNVGSALKLLAGARRALNLRQVFYYTWLTPDSGHKLFDYAGMRRLNQRTRRVTPKPTQAAYRSAARRLEGCAKDSVANACGRGGGARGR